MKEFVVKAKDAGVRADVFIASKYPNFSRSSLEALFDKDMISVSSHPIKASYKVKAKETVLVDDSYIHQQPAKIELPIIYEDEDVIVIDKQAGVLTHSKGALKLEGSVASFIAPRVKGIEGNRAGIVHRLDRGNSGVIICAKNQLALTQLQRQFS